MLEHAFAAARWIAVTGLLVVAAARIARALVPGARQVPLLETFVVTALLTTAGFAIAGLAGVLSNVALAVFSAGLFLGTMPLRRKPATPAAARRSGLVPTLLGAPLLVDLPVYLAAPPVNWDAMTYHLFLPARWIQEGRLFHVPTVFSDNAAAYAPQNGALLFGWSMSLLGNDSVTNILQWAAVAALAMASFRMGRALGVSPRLAAIAAMTPFWMQPIRAHAASANVDVWMLAFFAAALAWLAGYSRRPSRSALLLCGVAAGLAAGTKTVGLSLGLLVGVPAVFIALRRRRAADLGPFAAGALASGGWWYVRNLLLYGNPLFPLDFGLFRGAYGTNAIRAGEFHLDAAAAFARVLDKWGVLLCALLFAGVLALFLEAFLLRRLGRVRRAGVAGLLGALAVVWTVWFFFIVPHNGQTRFLLPVAAIALVGWIAIVGRIAVRGEKPACWFAVATMIVLGVSGRPDRDWAAYLRVFREAEVAIVPIAICVLAIALGFLVAHHRSSRPLALCVSVAAAVGALTLGIGAADSARVAAYGNTAYRMWAEGFIPFQNPDVPAQRIAYAGANIPYPLTGPGFRHTVVYCNTRGHSGDGFYEHWRRDPRTYDYHKPGIYRGDDDSYATWLECLRAEKIDTIVLFALHRAERGSIPATDSGFTDEQSWIAEHPDTFETLARGEFAEVHRLRR